MSIWSNQEMGWFESSNVLCTTSYYDQGQAMLFFSNYPRQIY